MPLFFGCSETFCHDEYRDSIRALLTVGSWIKHGLAASKDTEDPVIARDKGELHRDH